MLSRLVNELKSIAELVNNKKVMDQQNPPALMCSFMFPSPARLVTQFFSPNVIQERISKDSAQ